MATDEFEYKDLGVVIADVTGNLDAGTSIATFQASGFHTSLGWSYYKRAIIAVDFTYSDATEVQAVVEYGPSAADLYPVQAQDHSAPPDVTLNDQNFLKTVTANDKWVFETPVSGQYMKLTFTATFAGANPKDDSVAVRVLLAD